MNGCEGMSQLGRPDTPAGSSWPRTAGAAARWVVVRGWHAALDLAERFEAGQPSAVILIAACLSLIVASAERVIDRF